MAGAPMDINWHAIDGVVLKQHAELTRHIQDKVRAHFKKWAEHYMDNPQEMTTVKLQIVGLPDPNHDQFLFDTDVTAELLAYIGVPKNKRLLPTKLSKFSANIFSTNTTYHILVRMSILISRVEELDASQMAKVCDIWEVVEALAPASTRRKYKSYTDNDFNDFLESLFDS
ncbi:hypothetical protein G7054_g9630 [Neopestalotiopsis clavispora]|nr:hypothetical protein G7054_g9630 [Neopestalotiopsis clavispora]